MALLGHRALEAIAAFLGHRLVDVCDVDENRAEIHVAKARLAGTRLDLRDAQQRLEGLNDRIELDQRRLDPSADVLRSRRPAPPRAGAAAAR